MIFFEGKLPNQWNINSRLSNLTKSGVLLIHFLGFVAETLSVVHLERIESTYYFQDYLKVITHFEEPTKPFVAVTLA